MNNTTKIPQKSRVSLNANRLSDNTITGPIEVGISRIAVNFGKISQNPLNFAARVGLGTVQKIDFLGGVA